MNISISIPKQIKKPKFPSTVPPLQPIPIPKNRAKNSEASSPIILREIRNEHELKIDSRPALQAPLPLPIQHYDQRRNSQMKARSIDRSNSNDSKKQRHQSGSTNYQHSPNVVFRYHSPSCLKQQPDANIAHRKAIPLPKQVKTSHQPSLEAIHFPQERQQKYIRYQPNLNAQLPPREYQQKIPEIFHNRKNNSDLQTNLSASHSMVYGSSQHNIHKESEQTLLKTAAFPFNVGPAISPKQITLSPRNSNNTTKIPNASSGYSSSDSEQFLQSKVQQLELRLRQKSLENSKLSDQLSQSYMSINALQKVIRKYLSKKLKEQTEQWRDRQRSYGLQIKKLENALKIAKVHESSTDKKVELLQKEAEQRNKELQKCHKFIKEIEFNMVGFKK